MSLGRGLVAAVGLTMVFSGVAMSVSSCQEQKRLRPQYNQAAVCEQKLQSNLSCSLEEQKAMVAVKDNQKKSKDAMWYVIVGDVLIDLATMR